jgi:hypothetical protein
MYIVFVSFDWTRALSPVCLILDSFITRWTFCVFNPFITRRCTHKLYLNVRTKDVYAKFVSASAPFTHAWTSEKNRLIPIPAIKAMFLYFQWMHVYVMSRVILYNSIHLESCTWQKFNRDSCLSCPNSSYGTGNKCTREIIIGLNASRETTIVSDWKQA